MKSFTQTNVLLALIIMLGVETAFGQQSEKIENHGRKSAPSPAIQSFVLPGSNTDAPAGSISVAENAIYNAYTPEQLVQNLLVTGCLTASNIRFGYYKKNSNGTWSWTNHTWSATPGDRQMAYFNKATSTFPLDEGIILTSGKASSAMGPNNAGNKSDKMVSAASDPDLNTITGNTMYDASVLEFDFVPAGNTLEFTYIFTSEEYIEYCETEFNDAFGFFLSGPGINGTYTNNAVNLATILNNIPVTINDIHPAGTNVNNVNFPAENAAYYLDNPSGSVTMQFDGSTVILTATYPVVPCSTYKIKMSVADASDQQWDGAVFLGARSFNSENINLNNYGNFIEDENNVFEGCNNFFRVTRTNPDQSQPLTVNLILSGTCTNGVDIQTTGNLPFPSTVIIPANAAYVDIPYVAPNDGIADNDETLIVQVITSCPCAANLITVTKTINIYETVVIQSVSAVNAQCNGQNNGTITVNATGGSGSYLYSINNGTSWQGTNNFTGLSAGNYTVKVKDPGSCFAPVSSPATIGNPAPIAANAGPDVSICQGESTQLNGTGGVLYSWSPATGLNFTNIANPIASPTSTTTYTLTVTNAQGQCTSTDQVTVTINPVATAPTSISVDRSISCNDDNGNIVLTATGGSGTSLKWSSGTCGSSVLGTGSTLTIASPTTTTTYFAWWENSCGSSACAQLTISVPSPIQVSLSAGNISCFGGTTTLTVTASGGTGSLQYSLNGGTYQPGNTFSVNATASPYTVTVKDANNCTTASSPLAVTQPSQLLFGTVNITNVSCTGATNGQIQCTVSGGTGSKSYTISPNTGTQTPSGTFTSLPANTYIITVTDANGCQTSSSYVIGTTPDITAPTIVSCAPNQSAFANASCQAAVPNFTASVTATDNCTSTPSLVITQSHVAGTLVSTGVTTVTITVTDAAGNFSTCSATFTVTDNTAPTIVTCAPNQSAFANASCQSAVPSFTANVTATDNCTATPSLVITQSPAAGTMVSTGVTTVTITVTDAAGNFSTCSANFTVTDNISPTIVTCAPNQSAFANASCQAAVPNFTANVTATDNCTSTPSLVITQSPAAGTLVSTGVTTVTITVTDAAGNFSTCSANFTVTDNISPTIVTCAPNQSAFANASCQSAVPNFTANVTANDNCTATPSLVITQSPAAGTMVSTGVTTVTITVTDAAGNFSTCSANFTVTDNISPSIVTCAPNQSAFANASCQAAVPNFTANVTATDNCTATPSLLITQSPAAGTMVSTGVTSVTITVTDAAGNFSTCSANFTVSDNTAPTIVTCAPNQSAFANAACQSAVPDFTANVSATGNCTATPSLVITQSPAAGTMVSTGVTTVTITVTDAAGNFSTCSANFTVTDNTSPTIVTCAPNQSAFANASCQAAVPNFTANVTATDNCTATPSLLITQSPAAGTLVSTGVTTVTITVTDAAGNFSTCSATFTITDNTNPTIVSCAPNQSAFANASCQSAVTDFTANVTANDNCTATPSLVITQSPTAGTLVSTGVTTVTITVTDAAGNFSTCSVTFTVTDNTAPTIVTCAPNQSAFANASCQAAVPNFTANVTATDNCTATPSLVITQSPAAGTLVSTGVTTVTISVTDAAGNFSTCSANFTVTDNTAPTIVTCAPNQSAFANASCQSAVPDFTANVSATDNCTATPSLVITQSPAAGTLVSTGVTTVTITVTDAAGNFSTCSATFTVTDNTAPTIVTCAPNQSAFANASCQSAVPDFTANVSATDNCTATPSLVITQSPAAGTMVSTGVTTVTITVTDAAGNFSTCSANFTVTDNTSPTIVTCAPNQSAFANASCQAAIPDFTANVTATDNCTSTPSLVITQSPAAGTMVSTGVTTVTITVTDAAGNFSTCSATFTITDNTNPTIVSCAPNQSAFANASCQSAVPDFMANVTANDNCTATPSLVITQSPAAGTMVSTGVTTVTITVTDDAGNFSTCSATFTVTDNTAPTIVTCAPNQSAFANASCQAAVPDFTANVTATDNCTSTPSLVITQSPAAGTMVSTGVTTVTITVTDAAGNFSTCSANFTVTDNISPTIVTCAPNQSAFANASCQAAVPDFTTNVTATDNCTATPSLVITQSPAAGTLVSTGVTTVTITVTDAAGNFSTCSANFTVTDNISPSIVTCAPNQSAFANASCQAAVPDFTANVTATDNCTATPSLVITQSPAAGTLVSSGVTTVIITVTDAAGNFSTCSANFTVSDNTAPTIVTCAPNQSAFANTSCQSAVPDFTANVTATDNCTTTPSLVITQSPAAGTLVSTGVTSVTITVTDAAGNFSTCSSTFTVTDNTAPTIVTCPATRNIEGCSASALTNPNYSQVLTLSDYAIFSGAANNGSATDNCGITEVSYQDIATGTCPVVVKRTWFIKDALGNTSECEQQINIDDTTDPVLTCPSNLELNTNNGNTYSGAIGNATATDNCDSDITITNNAPVSFPLGNTIVTWTATDDCGNSTTCDQTVSVSSLPIIANDDLGSTINGLTGGTSVSDVLVNDILNGLPVQASDITLSQVSSTNAGISLVGGSVVVAAGTPAGTYSLTYQICEIVNPTNCDQATVSVTVNAATIVANDDTGTPVNGYAGGTAVADVLVNDLLNGVAVNPTDITLSQVSSTNAGISLVGGSVVVAAGTPAGTYSLTYQICEILNPTNCDQATVSVSVNAASIVANDDTGTPVNGYAGGTAVSNVLVNDLLNGVAVNPSEITLSQVSSTNPGISLVGSSVVVAAGTPAGTYSLTYQICEILNPTNCDQATVSVTVNAASIVANDDTGTPVNGYAGGTAVANVLVNDLLNGVAVDPDDITLSQISSTNAGISLVGGSVVVAAGTPAGTYSLTYQICEILNPTNCDQATVSVTVNAASIVANDDTGTPVNGYAGGTAVANVLVNDLLNGVAVDASDITLSQISSTNAGISLVGGSVVVAAGTPAGTYSLTYQICEILNPTNCDQATVSVTVNAATIVANDDTGTPVNGYAGGTAVANVLVNDLLNGVAVDPDDITLSQVSSTNAGISLVGSSVVVASGTPAGTYSLTYQICEILNPTNCDQATVSVTVNAATIVANDDTGTPVNGYAGGTAVANVLVNDLLNGVAVDPSDITLSQISSTNAGISLVGGSVVVAAGTPAGTYSLNYQICEILNPTNCDQATVSVTVNAATIVANDDTGIPINGYTGGTAVANVLVNDLLNGVAVDASDITLSQISSTNAGISLIGSSVVVAAGIPAGTYSLTYQICEILNPTNCDQATVSVTVNAATIVANDDTGTPVNGYAGGTAVANVLVNDLLNGVAVDPDDITLSQVSSSNAGISLVGGSVVVAAGTPAGTYSLTYQICEILNPTNCDQATVSVTVNAASIVANDDTGTPVNGYAGGTAVANVLVNDLLNGVTVNPSDITLSQVSSTNAGISLVGSSVVVASGTPAGTYSLTYQICEILNPTNCDQASVSVTVNAATIVANDDTGTPVNGYAGGTAVANVLVNDLLNGVAVDPADITLSQVSSTNAGISLVGGSVVVAAGTPAGTYSLIYQICEILNPTNCDQATVSVTVNAATIVANDDTGTPVNGYAGGTAVADVLVNDLLNGVAVDPDDITLSQVSSTNAGISLVGGSVVVAAGTPAGTYSLTYQICEILNPTNCDQAMVSVSVTAPSLEANEDSGNMNGCDGGIAVTNVLNNDLLNGLAVIPAEVILTVITPASDPGIVLNPVTGSVTVANGTQAGNYSIVYQICEVLNPTICDQSTVVITIVDNELPTISCPLSVNTVTDPGLCTASGVSLGTATTTDNCQVSSLTNNAPLTYPVGTTTVTWTVTDASDQTATCDQLVIVTDNQPPSIICPANITVQANSGQTFASGVELGIPVTSDNCGIASTVNNSPTQFPLGITWVTWTVTDINGLSDTCHQSVLVTDNQLPVILCPPTITISCITELPAAYSTYAEFVNAGGSASDNDGINPASFILESQTSNNQSCPETISRVYKIADNSNNYSSCTQVIIIDDEINPTLVVPAAVIVSCSDVPDVGTATASDNCDTNPVVAYLGETRADGDCAGEYTLTRTWTATDACGNISSASQTINVQDISAPVIASLPAPTTIDCPATPEFATATATDECGSAFTLTYEDATTPGICEGAYSVTRTWTAADACGNISSASQTINVQDISAPVIASLPAPTTIDCPATPEFASATATDECGSAFTLTYEDATTPGICAGSYSVTRTWTATDACGNISSASQTINVQDISAPVIASLPAPTTIDCPATPEFATATATDECGSAFTLTYEDATTPGICAGSYSVTRTWTATDACGNISTSSQTINVQDISAPVIASLPAPTTIDCPATPEFATATATDECGSAFTLTYEDATTPGICAGAYSITRTWTATDACGNISSASQTINIQDISAPVIASLPAPTTIDCPATPEFATATATDECGSAFTLTYEDSTVPGICAGALSVTRTWTATDACGNISTSSQTINVQDISAPVIASLPAPTTIDCPATPEFATATATDECGSAFTLTYEDSTVPGICAGALSVTRTWTATDACGNISTSSQTINVQDISAPVIASLPAPTTIDCPATPEFATATATDECGSAFTLTYEDATTPGICAGAYSVTRTWTATDACGNISTSSQTINVQDISAPVIASLPAPTTIDCPATPEFATATATDECGSAFTLTYEDATTPGICAGAYSVTRTWTATDACGNISTSSQTINVQDISAPVIASLPAPTTIDCPATPEFASATATDECGSAFTLTYKDATTPGICEGAYSVTRTWTATDACGNISSASQTINVQDISAPVIASLPAPTTIDCPATPEFATATATDECGSAFTLTYEDATTPGICAGAYSVTRTWTATDACGNISSASQTINVQDISAPVIASLPAPTTIDCPATPEFASATATDECGSAFTLTYEDATTPGICAGSYSVTRTWTATDACGNISSASQTINVQDISAPVIASLPAPTTIDCPATPEFASATATDECGSAFTLTYEDATTPGICAGAYSVIRTWTATDACGNISSASQTINVQDISAPVIASLPAPTTIDCPATPEFATATATDECGSAFTLTYEDATTPGICAGAYSVIRTWTATDACGNISSASQTINVQDISAPVFASLPAPTTIDCPATPEFATATATDECGSAFTLTYEDATTPGICAGAYSVIRTWTATDACGNISSASQTINVQDISAPVIASLPAPTTIDCPATPEFATATATDECGSAFTLTYEDSTVPGICAGALSVTRTWTATDACGNISTSSQTINVQDISAPVIASLPAPTTIDCPATPEFATATATDECGSAFTLTYEDATTPGICAGAYSVIRTWTATDACGNISSASQTINVQDISAPVIASLPAPTTIDCPATPEFATATATDECGSAFTLTYEDATTPGICAGAYSVTRTWTATDACGNISSASQTINVQDISAPVFASLPAPTTIDCPATPEFATATATDECGSAFTLTYEDAITPGICAGAYSVTRTWTATDACGNISTSSQTINVQDISAPVIASLPAPTTIDCPATPEFATATATDECGSAFTLTYEDATTPGICAGAYSVTRTWTATDACGNISSASQTINVQDISAPVIASLPAPTTIDCPATPEFATATATDECGSAFTLTYEDSTVPGICAGAYSVTRTWTATDACGNISSASQTINVQDISAPVIASLPAPTTIDCPATPEFATATATDECGSAFTLTFEDATTPGICAGAYSVIRTWTATDACGNISTSSQTINVQDISAPVIASLPAATTIDCPSTPEFATATATDECGSAFTLTYEDATTPGICAGAYSVTRTWTATDACGNSSTASQTINVRDITAPVVVCPGNITVNNDPGDCGANVIVPAPSVLETCGVASIINDLNSTSNASGHYPVGTTQILWTIVDECNNTATCAMSVTVSDNEAPVVQCPEDVMICSTESLNIGVATGSDNCGILSITNNAPANFIVGNTAVIWTVTDIHGNSSFCQQSITIIPMTIADAGPDATICQNSAGYQISGATASNFSSLLWTTTGNGSLLNANTISPTYVPQTGETGNVYLTLTASGIAPCSGTSDQLLLSIIPGPMVSAGDDATICENQVFVPTTSNAAYYNSILWTTSGTGTFNDPTILHPTYTPGATDIQSGTVVLTLTSIGSALCGNIADNMTLTVSEAIIAQAGPDEATCQGIPFTVNQASAQNAVSVYWTHNGLGTLTGNTTLNPTYTPAQNELGTILLTLHAEGLGTCGNNEDQMALSVHGIPQVFAGNDNTSCGNNPFVLSEATSSNIESQQWTTSGDGIFDVPTLLNATYLPGPNDLAIGAVTLKLTAIGYANCGIVKDSLVLTLTTEPSANAGPDASTCSSSPYTIQYANATSGASVNWTHNGNGTLNDATTLHPTYIPGINETGNVTLVLHITAYGNCGSVLDSMSLMLQEPALADAGNDLATCDQASVRITNSQASAYTSILWVSSGDGSFDDPTELHPLYSPGISDRANGLVRLSLHLQGITPCEDAVDEMLLSIGMSPKVYAGDDAYLCQNESFTITGATAISQGTISWQISPASSGVLSGANTLTPTFTPASGYFGEVILTLSQEGSSACANIVATDQVQLTVNKSPVANAGEDQVIGEDKRAKLNGSASEGSGLYAWKWQPEKFLEDATSMNPMTLPLGSTTTFTLTVMDLVSSCSGNDEITIFIGSPGFEIIARADYDTVLVNNSGKIEVLLNDIYPDNSKVTLSLCSNPKNGIAIINSDLTITYQPKRKFTGDDSLCYRICIDVTPEVCVDTMVYIHVRPTKIDDLLVVSGITPNDDNVNDDWTIRGIEDYPDNTVIIFNRWGDKIRSFSGYDNKEKVWDGKNEEGKPVPDGTYFYILEIKELGKSSGWIFVRGNRE